MSAAVKGLARRFDGVVPSDEIEEVANWVRFEALRTHDPRKASLENWTRRKLRWAVFAMARREHRRRRLIPALKRHARMTAAKADPREIAIPAALRGLQPRERALVERHYFGGEDFNDIAADLGISKSWASRLHARAIEQLRAGLGAERCAP